LKDKIKEFLTNPTNDPNLPEKEPIEVEGKTYMKSKGVISLQNDRGTSYQAYIAVQNELVKAVNELRDEFSRANFGKKFSRLSEEEQELVKKVVPQNISEAEPKDTGKK
jgi:tRNA U34 5-carboxymethylaminomethyl modifying enzyme MnmG/GidA